MHPSLSKFALWTAINNGTVPLLSLLLSRRRHACQCGSSLFYRKSIASKQVEEQEAVKRESRRVTHWGWLRYTRVTRSQQYLYWALLDFLHFATNINWFTYLVWGILPNPVVLETKIEYLVDKIGYSKFLCELIHGPLCYSDLTGEIIAALQKRRLHPLPHHSAHRYCFLLPLLDAGIRTVILGFISLEGLADII